MNESESKNIKFWTKSISEVKRTLNIHKIDLWTFIKFCLYSVFFCFFRKKNRLKIAFSIPWMIQWMKMYLKMILVFFFFFLWLYFVMFRSCFWHFLFDVVHMNFGLYQNCIIWDTWKCFAAFSNWFFFFLWFNFVGFIFSSFWRDSNPHISRNKYTTFTAVHNPYLFYLFHFATLSSLHLVQPNEIFFLSFSVFSSFKMWIG